MAIINSDLVSKAKLLWTNSNITTNFNAQTISIDLSNYDGIIIKGISSTSNKDEEEKTCICEKNNTSILIFTRIDWSYYVRQISCNESSITISNAYYEGTEKSVQNVCIPTKIYGIKFNYS